MTHYSLRPETYRKISEAQEPVNLMPDEQDRTDLHTAATMIKTGHPEQGWEFIVKVLRRKFGEPLTLQDAMILAAARERFEKQIEEVNNGHDQNQSP